MIDLEETGTIYNVRTYNKNAKGRVKRRWVMHEKDFDTEEEAMEFCKELAPKVSEHVYVIRRAEVIWNSIDE